MWHAIYWRYYKDLSSTAAKITIYAWRFKLCVSQSYRAPNEGVFDRFKHQSLYFRRLFNYGSENRPLAACGTGVHITSRTPDTHTHTVASNRAKLLRRINTDRRWRALMVGILRRRRVRVQPPSASSPSDLCVYIHTYMPGGLQWQSVATPGLTIQMRVQLDNQCSCEKHAYDISSNLILLCCLMFSLKSYWWQLSYSEPYTIRCLQRTPCHRSVSASGNDPPRQSAV